MGGKTDTEVREKDWADWAALTELIGKVESTHQCCLSLRITASSSGYRSFVDVDVSMTLPTLIGPAQPLRLSRLSHYPHPKHQSIASLLMEMVRQIDAQAGREAYRQRELPLTPPAE